MLTKVMALELAAQGIRVNGTLLGGVIGLVLWGASQLAAAI